MLDGAGAFHFGYSDSLAGVDGDEGIDLPGLAEVAGSPGGVVDVAGVGECGLGHSALAFLTGEILRGDGAGLGIGEPGEITQIHIKSVELLGIGTCNRQKHGDN